VMVEVDGLCVISFCCTAGKAKRPGHPTVTGKARPSMKLHRGSEVPDIHPLSVSMFK